VISTQIHGVGMIGAASMLRVTRHFQLRRYTVAAIMDRVKPIRHEMPIIVTPIHPHPDADACPIRMVIFHPIAHLDGLVPIKHLHWGHVLISYKAMVMVMMERFFGDVCRRLVIVNALMLLTLKTSRALNNHSYFP